MKDKLKGIFGGDGDSTDEVEKEEEYYLEYANHIPHI